MSKSSLKNKFVFAKFQKRSNNHNDESTDLFRKKSETAIDNESHDKSVKKPVEKPKHNNESGKNISTNKRLEYRKSKKYQERLQRKEVARKQKEHLRQNRKQIREEKEDALVEKLFAIKKKYSDRISKIESKFGKTQIELHGKNASKALIAISKIAKVKNVKTYEKGVRFVTESKQCHKIIALLQNLCYDYTIINIGGVSPSVIRSLSRVGLLLGVALSICAFSIYSSYVTRVSIACEGAKNLALNVRIADILKEYGVSQGAKVKDFDKSALEKAISALDGVAFASVTKQGTHITVLYKTELKRESFFQANAKSIVASKRAVITRVVVEGGTAVKKYGDVVDIGDTLIEGYIEYGDSKIPVEAKGYAFGKVYVKRTRFFANTQSVEEIVSRKKYTRYGIFGKTPKPPVSPFEKYRLKTDIKEYDFLVPLKIYSYEFEQICEVERQNTLDEQGMKKAVYSDALARLSESATVLDAYYETTKTEDGTYVTVTLEVEEII